MPKISVIVPVYNAEKYLQECVGSILNQTIQDIEVILVDDGSTDASSAICDAYARKDARVKVVHKENGGVSSARNEGLRHVTGDYYAFVDSDDFVDADMYHDMYVQAEKNNVPLVICSGYYYSSEACNSITDCTMEIQKLTQDDLINSFLLGNKKGYPVLAISLWCKLYRTSNFRHISFDETLKIAEDENYATFLSVACNDFCFIDKPYYYYRKNTESLTYRPFSESNCNILQVLYDRETCFEKHNLMLPAAKVGKNLIELYIFFWCEHTDCVDWVKKYRIYYKQFRKKYFGFFGFKTNVRYCIFDFSPELYSKWVLKR